mgnify:CR=1 FL=1
MSSNLKKLNNFAGVNGPVLTIVMDGVGIAPDTLANAVTGAYTPTLDMLMSKYPIKREFFPFSHFTPPISEKFLAIFPSIKAKFALTFNEFTPITRVL